MWIFAAIFVALISWGFSSPVGSSPDDNFHLASIWCSSSSTSDLCKIDDDGVHAYLPKQITQSAYCYIFNSSVSGSCQGENFSTLQNSELQRTDRLNSTGVYPPVFYQTMGLLSSTDFQKSVLIMRTINALLFTTVLALIMKLVPVRFSKPTIFAFLVTLVPLGMFIVPSTNPSSWGYFATGAYFAFLCGFLTSNSLNKWLCGIAAFIALILGAGSRADVAAYLCVATFASVLITLRPVRSNIYKLIVPAIFVSIALLFFTSGKQSSFIQTGFVDAVPQPKTPGLLLNNLVEFPSLIVGVLGNWGLGWLDTPMPSAVWAVSFAIFSIAIFSGLRNLTLGKSMALMTVTVVLISVPMIILFESGTSVGSLLQPRYLLPPVLLLTAVALIDTSIQEFSKIQKWAFIIGLSIANSIALFTNFRRYTIGLGTGSLNITNPDWWWNLNVSPLLIWGIGSIAFVIALIGFVFVFLNNDFTFQEVSKIVKRKDSRSISA